MTLPSSAFVTSFSMTSPWKPECLQVAFQLSGNSGTASSPSSRSLFNNVFTERPQGSFGDPAQLTCTISLKTSTGLRGGAGGQGFEHWSITCKRLEPKFSFMSSVLELKLVLNFWLMHLVPFSGIFSLRSRMLEAEDNSWQTVSSDASMYRSVAVHPFWTWSLSAEMGRRDSHQRTGSLATASGKEIST